MLLKLVNLSSSDSYTLYTMDNIRSKVSDAFTFSYRNPKFKSVLFITFAFKILFCSRNTLYFYSNYVLIIPATNNNIRQMFSEHFFSSFFFFFSLPENQKKSSAKEETEQTEQTCNNTSFSPVWITIISCEIESLIARIRYDDDQLAPVRK